MARLPTPGSDTGNWGVILNDYLSQSLSSTGSLKANTVGAEQLADNTVTGDTIVSGSVSESLLDNALQAKINSANAGIADDSITAAKLQNNSVTSVKITDGAITSDKIAEGAVTQSMVGLSNVDNTSDANKPVSSDAQEAIDAKADTAHTHTIADVTNLQATLNSKVNTADIGTKTLLIDNVSALPAGTPAGVIVVVKS